MVNFYSYKQSRTIYNKTVFCSRPYLWYHYRKCDNLSIVMYLGCRYSTDGDIKDEEVQKSLATSLQPKPAK